MNFDKISLTLYDLIGYLLPGTILLMTLSTAEATFPGFCNSHLLTLKNIQANPVPFVILAYYGGQICHVIGSTVRDRLGIWAAKCHAGTQPLGIIKTRWLRLIEPKGSSVAPAISEEIEKEVCKAYNLTHEQLGSSSQARDSSCCLLADNFVQATAIVGEREVFLAREGFFKASFAAFLGAFLLLVISLPFGGAAINQTAQEATKLGWIPSALVGVICLGIAIIFYHRQAYFACLKRIHVKLLFLALRRATHKTES